MNFSSPTCPMSPASRMASAIFASSVRLLCVSRHICTPADFAIRHALTTSGVSPELDTAIIRSFGENRLDCTRIRNVSVITLEVKPICTSRMLNSLAVRPELPRPKIRILSAW